MAKLKELIPDFMMDNPVSNGHSPLLLSVLNPHIE